MAPSTDWRSERFDMPQQEQSQSLQSSPPPIQSAPSAGSASLAYSMDTEAMEQMAAASSSSNTNSPGAGQQSSQPQQQHRQQQQQPQSQLPPRIQSSPTADESIDYSIYSSGEMSAEQYYNAHTQSQQQQYHQYQEQQQQPIPQQQLSTVNEGDINHDATPTVHVMHRKLLHLLSTPHLFAEAMEWQSKVDRGLDPSKPSDEDEDESGGNGNNGIKSFDNEFNEEQSRNTASDEHKDEVVTEDGNDGTSASNTNADDTTTTTTEGGGTSSSSKYKDQQRLIPPLPLQIFAPDAEVVLPQALTASQLFGIERVTGIELEAAAGMTGLSQLFLRWLALMPEGDHMNVIDPPGLTVMRISGGRYRVTGAHRVVWRWMNKFSPAAMFTVPSDIKPTEGSGSTEEEDASKPDTDFDFGDLVTMTIIDVFETDGEGRLLSYCPTFDNRAVHKTVEVAERIRKGASHLKERMEVVARSPAGKSVNKAADNFGKMTIRAALSVGNIVKNKIEEEIHKHQHPEQHNEQNQAGGGGDVSVEDSATDAVGGEDIAEGGEGVLSKDGQSASKGEGYFSDESTSASPRRMEV